MAVVIGINAFLPMTDDQHLSDGKLILKGIFALPYSGPRSGLLGGFTGKSGKSAHC
jgi:hypothetical protein